MRNNNTINALIESFGAGDIIEIRESSMVIVAHVHTAVKHDRLGANAH